MQHTFDQQDIDCQDKAFSPLITQYGDNIAAQRLAAQALGRLPLSYDHFSRKSKTAINCSLAEPWPSRLKPRVGRTLFFFFNY
jgi:hypothetical protein